MWSSFKLVIAPVIYGYLLLFILLVSFQASATQEILEIGVAFFFTFTLIFFGLYMLLGIYILSSGKIIFLFTFLQYLLSAHAAISFAIIRNPSREIDNRWVFVLSLKHWDSFYSWLFLAILFPFWLFSFLGLLKYAQDKREL